VKRQTLILVDIGVALFVAGGGIAFASVLSGTKNQSPQTVAPANTPVVVATHNIPAGTTGQDMVSQGLVAIQLVSHKHYSTSDVPTLQGLTDEVLTSPVTKGDAVRVTQLTASTTSIALPKNQDGITITTSAAGGLAGYLQPGTRVDIYANITKLSQASGSTTPVPAGLAIPCTELVMSNIQVLDVSNTVPALATHPSSTGRNIPASFTLLLAVNAAQARQLTFMGENETLSVTQTQSGTIPVPVGECIGTAQTTAAP
jgi:Flp pilus assembly protein CpaB